MVKRRLRRGGCVAWRQVARTVDCQFREFRLELSNLPSVAQSSLS